MIMPDIRKFKFPEMFNDSNGKTDPSKVIGFFSGAAAILGFIISGSIAFLISNFTETTTPDQVSYVAQVVDLSKDLMSKCLLLMAASTTLLAVDRVSKDKKIEQPTEKTDAGA